MNILLDRFRKTQEYGHIRKGLAALRGTARRYPSQITGLCEGASYAFLAALTSDENAGKPALLIVADEKTAARTRDALRALGTRAEVFPTRDPVFYNMIASHELEHERISVLTKILKNDVDIVISACDAALGFTVPKDVLTRSETALAVGDEYPLDDLRNALVLSGYVHSDLVDGKGQFSVRGGIVDVFPPCSEQPVRIEYFGDEIDQMKLFDPLTQRSTEQIQNITITAAREILVDDAARAKIADAISDLMKKAPVEARQTLARELDTVQSELDVPFADKYISVVYPESVCLLDYFDEKTLVFALDHAAIADRLKGAFSHITATVADLIERGLMSSKYASFLREEGEFYAFLERGAALIINSFDARYRGKLAEIYSFKTRATSHFSGNFDALADDVRMYSLGGSAVLILCGNQQEASSLAGLLSDADIPAVYYPEYSDISDLPDGRVAVASLDTEGFELVGEKFVCISLGEGGEKRRSRYRRKTADKRSAKEKLLSYADLSVGDYVVHETHGIGIYLGIESVLGYDGTRNDHIKIQYAGTGILYVPCERIESVSKYIGGGTEGAKAPKLSKLGGGEWERTKSRVKSEVKSMAKELIALYAERMRKPGFAFSPDDDMQREFESTFEYEETEGQLIAASEIKADMEKPIPMDRLLCGDVGFGKTEVALRAAFKAVADNKQVAILVPTTILAMQHYQTILSRMRDFPVRTEMLSRFCSPNKQQSILRALARGDVDIIVGTHRILSEDIKFRDLGLLIVDEEQRFGVAHKEKLKQLARNVDVLTLTATPIPRTLNMAMSDMRDMSVLDEAPFDRLPVQTYVLEHDDEIVCEAIRRELQRGGQVFYLHNNTTSIYSRAARLKEKFPEAEIAVAHGKMDKDALSDVWQSLVDGDIDILVCTTIIETGVDVPNANTLIIENADRMGLAQLHQLRGRVGRSSRRAYAYFTFFRGRALTEAQTKRLQAIRDFTEFGSGFKIAMRDLEIRGAGDILGARQSGHMESVGYDLYVKILNEAVLEERGETPEKKAECTVNIGRDSYIPESYIANPAQRIDVYKKIARITASDDVDDIAEELLDRYGDLPPSVETLMNVSLARALGSECGFTQIERKGSDVVIYPAALDVLTWSYVSDAFPNAIMIMPSDRPRVTCKNRKNEPIFKFVIGIMKKYREMKSKTP
ncbi:MAG: transcription-repair coupling factor [Clostridia bacterium]|nr:transcription-repair coupling factor [Clostridia bacterium]